MTGTGDTVDIDIGTVSITLALLDSNGQLAYRDSCFHGNIHAALEAMLGKLPGISRGVSGLWPGRGENSSGTELRSIQTQNGQQRSAI